MWNLGFFFSFLSFTSFLSDRYFLTHLKFEFKLNPGLTIEGQIYDLPRLVIELSFKCLFIYLHAYSLLHSFISLVMDRTLDKNLCENTLTKDGNTFSFTIKATSTINHDYRKFPS